MKTNWGLVGATLLLFAAGVLFLLHEAPPTAYKVFGYYFLVIGVSQLLFFRKIGKRESESARKSKMPKFGFPYWQLPGVQGAQFISLGIGIILTIASMIALLGGWDGLGK